MRPIDLLDLDCDILFDYNPPTIGGRYPDTGEHEIIPAEITITSVKCNGVEIISIIPSEQLLEMEQECLEELASKN